MNMSVSYIPRSGTITALEDTIDYAKLFALLNEAMQEPVDLLETLAQELASKIQRLYPEVQEIEIEVEKLNPPIDSFNGSAAVKLLRKK